MATSPIPSPAAPSSVAADPPEERQQATSDNKRLKLPLSEGILLAISSASAYLWTFQYERGFTSHFGVPAEFINVGLANVLFLTVLVIGFIFWVIPIINFFVMLLFPAIGRHPSLRRQATILAIVLPFIYVPAFLYGTWMWWISAIGVTAVLGFLEFGLPLFRKEVGYMNKLEAQAKKDRSDPTVTLYGLAMSRLAPNLVIAIWFFMSSFVIAHQAGDAAAANQKEFLVTASNSEEIALLRVYGDILILAPLDRSRKEVQKSFVIIRVQDLKTPLTVEDVGPLNPVKSRTAPSLQVPSPSPQSTATAVPTATPKT